jgi:hypothetical protein
MKTAVDKVGRGKQRQTKKRFHAMVGHYLYEPEFYNPAVERVRGREDDHRATGSTDAPLPYPRDRQRQVSPEALDDQPGRNER